MKLSTLIAARAQQISVTGQFHSNYTGVIPSPCLSICRMTRDGSHCEGCFRTLDEIRTWSQAGAARRRAIWADLLRRAGVALPEELA
ncbi:MAG: DUF1289 domain-containing protein [Alicycliphilus sp.]|nr:DUF1289 domain-containing protein [Alicycliphilus sp.]MCA0440570.1 DUF1289 domain-containing protein [Pseudomonadota bacterium]MBP7329576.1 DUF1289 domain-containing protein [Alicycliphilus sp.]MBP8137698.1 DUF1289 domain-containing protein [Alicycliphilus sp.]TXJ08007.1 MAG: DUF1289 domain-containing protein [Alicycliphilus sp.]